jgi:hypothetical protein
MRGAEQFSPRTRLFTGRPAEYRATVARVRAAGGPVVVGRAPARTEVRSVVVPPGLPVQVAPDESWFRLEDPSLTAGGLDGTDAVATTAAAPPPPVP